MAKTIDERLSELKLELERLEKAKTKRAPKRGELVITQRKIGKNIFKAGRIYISTGEIDVKGHLRVAVAFTFQAKERELELNDLFAIARWECLGLNLLTHFGLDTGKKEESPKAVKANGLQL